MYSINLTCFGEARHGSPLIITIFGPPAKLIMVPNPNQFWFLSETDVDPQDITDYGPWASTAEVPWCGPIHGLNKGGATPSPPQKKEWDE